MTKFCPSCGEQLVDNAKFCKNCGTNLEKIEANTENASNFTQESTQQYSPQIVENDHKIAIIIGYILAILIPLFGFIAGIYLVTRKDSENAKKHGKFVILVAAVVWFISFMLIR